MTTLVYPKRPRKGSGYSFTQNRKRGMDGFGEALHFPKSIIFNGQKGNEVLGLG